MVAGAVTGAAGMPAARQGRNLNHRGLGRRRGAFLAAFARAHEHGRDLGNVVEALALDGGGAQRSRRVVHREHEGVPRARLGIGGPRGSVDLADACAGHERGHRVPAQGDDDGGVEDLQLPAQVRRAGRDLVGLGVPVVRRPALHDVRDEHILSLPADGGEQPHQQRPGPAHERPALAILVEAGALADEHHFGVGVALARDRAGAALVQAAAGADPDLARDLLERRTALDRGHAGDRPAAATGRRWLLFRTQPRSTSASAISTALEAAPLRRLSETTQNARPRLPGIDGSWRTRPT